MKRKIGIIILIIVLVLVLVVGGGLLLVLQSMNSGGVADYDTRLEIWDTVAGNSSRSKLEDMNIDYDSNLLSSTLEFATAIVGDAYVDAEKTIDTFTYFYEIAGGYEKDTYEDAPYLIPYPVDGSDSAIIVIPGGGYGYKSMDGTTGEGKDVALALNQAGISAFVLHYRANPYENPIPQLDVQRAVRYLRFHAAEFGFDPEKIGLIGFSAGGNQVGTYINTVMGNNLFPEDYLPDEVDRTNDSVVAVGMIYPALTYQYNVPMLFCTYDADAVRDEYTRNKLLEETDLSANFRSSRIPQFIAYSREDGMVDYRGTEQYITVAEDKHTLLRIVTVEGQDHGFQQKYYMNDFLNFFNKLIDSIENS